MACGVSLRSVWSVCVTKSWAGEARVSLSLRVGIARMLSRNGRCRLPTPWLKGLAEGTLFQVVETFAIRATGPTQFPFCLGLSTRGQRLHDLRHQLTAQVVI